MSTPKRKVGRPKKNPRKEPRPREGVIAELKNNFPPPNQIVMSIMYDNPMRWKRVFDLFKSMSASGLHMKFSGTDLTITTQDHVKRNKVMVPFHGARQHHYYCPQEFEANILQQKIDDHLQTVDANFDLIRIYSRAIKRRSFLYMQLNHAAKPRFTDLQELELMDSDKCERVSGIEEALAAEKDYPIKFRLEAKVFKKYINNVIKKTKELTIQKKGKDPLKFQYVPNKGKGIKERRFNHAEDIQLESNVAEDDIFAVTAYASDIKPMTCSCIDDYIYVSADKNRPLIFSAYLDCEIDGGKPKLGTQAVTIKVITNIVTAS